MATTEPHAGQRSDAKAGTADLPKSPSSEPPAWPSHDLIRRNGAPSVGERAGAVRPGPLPGSEATDAAAIAAAIRASEKAAATADVTAAEIEAAEAAAAELAAEDLTGELDEVGSADAILGEPAADAGDVTGAAQGRHETAPKSAGAARTVEAATTDAAPSPAPASSGDTRRPTKFMADLTAAMRAAAEAARESAVVQLRTDAVAEVETIRSDSTVYSANRRERAEEDVAAIREWSKAEIARIRAETEEGIVARRHRLDEEMVEQAARLEEAINRVEYTVAGYEQRMAQFFDRLLQEEDPSRFATMAGQLPEPPPFEPWSPEPTAALVVADQAALDAAADADATDETAMTAADEDVESPAAQSTAIDDADSTSTMVAVGPGEPAGGAANSAVAIIPDAAADTSEQATSDEGSAGTTKGAGKAARTATHELTQVIVVGLVSVASIATFKRMIARTPGVKSVHVSSGPQGEFVFGVTHDPSVDVMATVMSMEGFSPTVVAVRAGEISVAARDPEQAA